MKRTIIQTLQPSATERVFTKNDAQSFAHLADLDLPSGGQVEVIIGTDVPSAHWCMESRFGINENEPFAERRLLGWVAMGPRFKNLPGSISVMATDGLLKLMYEADFKDASVFDVKLPMSDDDKKALHFLEDNVKLENDRFVCPLPFKDDASESLQSNRAEVLKRAKYLARKLERDSKLREEYIQSMNKHFEKGHFRAAPKNEDGSFTPGRCYLPHFPVIKDPKLGQYSMGLVSLSMVNH